MAAKKSPKRPRPVKKAASAVKAVKRAVENVASPRQSATRSTETAADPIREALSSLRDRGLSPQ